MRLPSKTVCLATLRLASTSTLAAAPPEAHADSPELHMLGRRSAMTQRRRALGICAHWAFEVVLRRLHGDRDSPRPRFGPPWKQARLAARSRQWRRQRRRPYMGWRPAAGLHILAKACAGMRRHAQACACLRRSAQACTALHRLAQVGAHACALQRLLAQVCAWLRMPLRRHARAQACAGMRTHAQVCADLCRLAQAWHVCAGVCACLPKLAQACAGLRGPLRNPAHPCARLRTSAQACAGQRSAVLRALSSWTSALRRRKRRQRLFPSRRCSSWRRLARCAPGCREPTDRRHGTARSHLGRGTARERRLA